MFRRRDQQASADEREVELLVGAWHRTCESVGLTNDVDTVTGITHVVPRIDHIRLGPPTVLSVRLTPGMMPEDFTAQARRIARSMGAQSLRAEPRGYTHVVVTLLDCDPLSDTFSLPHGPVTGPVLIGRDESGAEITSDPAELGHVAVQGATGSGKSGFLYSLLAQLAERARAGYPLAVGGVDPSGLLLRPFRGSLLGLSDPAEVERYLSAAVDDMDARTAAMPEDRDVLVPDEEHPLRFLILEEYPGLLRWLDAIDVKAGKRCRAYVARLLAEGRKAGIRVVLVAQRAEAGVIGSTERGQCSTRLSFRVDNTDAARLLHPDATPELAAAHAAERPGIALLSAPGRPVCRIRAPWIGGYSTFVHRCADERSSRLEGHGSAETDKGDHQ